MEVQRKHISTFNQAYFIGVGGIGMSSLARYFIQKGWKVGGYDKTRTKLTDKLQEEGIEIHFEDLGPELPIQFKDRETTMVIYTPAVQQNMGELHFLMHNDFTVMKRAEVLGMITRDSKSLAVAGTHGKTTTSSMLAHILNESSMKCSAFLGGISTNFNSNFIGSKDSNLTVVEADEFDRSFLQLKPFASIVTTTDADHLDIYQDDSKFQEGFQAYAALIDQKGFLVQHVNVQLQHPNTISYGMFTNADFSGENGLFEQGEFSIDVNTPQGKWERVVLGLPGTHNAENALACIALLVNLGLTEAEIRHGLKTFLGVKRRFEFHVRNEDCVYIDDYAHHPTEIKALIDSVELLYPHAKITAVFQPHLFSRTRDFFDGFAEQLSRVDEIILLPIYPAREEPIEGITSDALCAKISAEKKSVLSPSDAISYVANTKNKVVLTIGAGDIDCIVEPLKNALEKR